MPVPRGREDNRSTVRPCGQRDGCTIRGAMHHAMPGTPAQIEPAVFGVRNLHRWRSTEQALNREKWLLRQKAGPYYTDSGPKPPNVLLAERVEQIVSEEDAEWRAGLHQTTRVSEQPTKDSGPQATSNVPLVDVRPPVGAPVGTEIAASRADHAPAQ